MKTLALICSIAFLLVILAAVVSTTMQRYFPFVRKLDESTRSAYYLLAGTALALFVFSRFDLQLQSFEVAGLKAQVTTLQNTVNTFSAQMETFYRGKKIEVFDRRNWNRVREVGKSDGKFTLEVTLENEAIPGSIEVFEGVLQMPETEYRTYGKTVQFPANTDKPHLGLVLKYFPRIGEISVRN